MLLFALGFALPAQTTGAIPTYTVEGNIREQMALGDSLLFYVDTAGLYGIEDVLLFPDELFVQSPPPVSADQPFFIWTRIRIKNEGIENSNLYASSCLNFKSFWLYTVVEGSVIGKEYTSMLEPPKEKSVLTKSYFLPLSLEAGAVRTYFIRLLAENAADLDHRKHLSLTAQKSVHHSLATKQIWQAFYAGVMLLFCVFSLFLFRIFREKSFVYFALQTFFFILYFLEVSGLIEAFLTNRFLANNVNLSIWLVSGLVWSIFLFTSHRLALKRRCCMNQATEHSYR